MRTEVKIIHCSSKLPELSGSNFFQSRDLFVIAENAPGVTPYMAVVMHDGKVRAHLLALLRKRGNWVPPYLYTHVRIYGEGEYADEQTRAEDFNLMITALTRLFRRKLCLFIEISDMSSLMFGYKYLRANGYFPINWQEVRNSLHSKAPSERLSGKMRRRIAHSYKMGVQTRDALNLDEVHSFYRILKRSYRSSLVRVLPSERQFDYFFTNPHTHVSVTTYKDKVIGGSVCVFTDGSAYLWYMAAQRKRYMPLHPLTLTVWHALNYAYKHNYAHMVFLDMGLPVHGNHLRNFILNFGGISVAKFKWFHFNIRVLNGLLSWFYRE